MDNQTPYVKDTTRCLTKQIYIYRTKSIQTPFQVNSGKTLDKLSHSPKQNKKQP